MDDDDIAGVAERLVKEFSGLSPIRVLEAVSDAAGEYGTYSPMFLEQAARARLAQPGDGPGPPSVVVGAGAGGTRAVGRRPREARSPASAAEDQRALHFLDRLGDLDAARAGLGAVEGGAAAPHALLVVEDLQALVGALVAAVEDEPVRADDRLRAEVLPVAPVDRAGRRARGAQDALGGVVEAVPVGLATGSARGSARCRW